MAISKIWNIGQSGTNNPGQHLKNSIDYINNPIKTQQGKWTGNINCLSGAPYEDMIDTKRAYGKMDLRQGYHMIVSFKPGEVDESLAAEITTRFAQEYLGERYEIAWAIHNDMPHIHGHIIFNSVSFVDGIKYHYQKGDWKRYINPIVNKLCKEYGLTTIEFENAQEEQMELEVQNQGLEMQEETCVDADIDVEREMPQTNGKTLKYHEWEAKKEKRPTWYQLIRLDVDECILQANTYTEFLQNLYSKGYQIRQGVHLSLCPPGREKPVRSHRLGNSYTVENIISRIFANKEMNYSVVPAPSIKGANAVYEKQQPHFLYKRNFLRMTPARKKYFAKLYRTGKIRKLRNSEYYNKEALQRYYQLRDEMKYMTRVGIANEKQLNERETQIDQYIKELYQARKALSITAVGDVKQQREGIRKSLVALKKEKRLIVGVRRDFMKGGEVIGRNERHTEGDKARERNSGRGNDWRKT